MAKKHVLVLALVVFLSGSLFAQKQNKHEAGDMLIGGGFGAGFSPNIFRMPADMSNSEYIAKGNYANTFELGVHFDYYLNSWLSFNTGISLKSGTYIFKDQDYYLPANVEMDELEFMSDVFTKTPILFTVPIMAHINFPFAQWFYAGTGVQLNFPLMETLDKPRSDFFIGVPIDLGLDFIKAGRGGMRFFFRVTPEFHEGKVVAPIGFNWQFVNFKVR
jgi:hypothetical protein